MGALTTNFRFARLASSLLAGAFVFNAGLALADGTKATLSGDEEVPAIKTSASGEATITVGTDKSVTGSVKTSDIIGTAVHIHLAASGKNGPPIIYLVKTGSLTKTGGDNVWLVPLGAKLTDAQFESFKAGDLYVNVHSEKNRGGEIRGQLKP